MLSTVLHCSPLQVYSEVYLLPFMTLLPDPAYIITGTVSSIFVIHKLMPPQTQAIPPHLKRAKRKSLKFIPDHPKDWSEKGCNCRK